MASSVKTEEVLLLEEEVTESRVLSPARLMVVDVKVLLVWMAVWDTNCDVSSCRRVVTGLSWGSLSCSVCIQELASKDTAAVAGSDACSVLAKSFQFLLMASVIATKGVEVSVSVDRPIAAGDLLLVSVKGCVCSVPEEKRKKKQIFVYLLIYFR